MDCLHGKWPLDAIKAVFSRRYLLQNCAVELYTSTGSKYFQSCMLSLISRICIFREPRHKTNVFKDSLKCSQSLVRLLLIFCFLSSSETLVQIVGAKSKRAKKIGTFQLPSPPLSTPGSLRLSSSVCVLSLVFFLLFSMELKLNAFNGFGKTTRTSNEATNS